MLSQLLDGADSERKTRNFLFYIRATLVALTFLNGEVMAVEAKDFFTGDYLKFALAVDREDISSMREISKNIDLDKKIGDKQMTVFVYAVANKKTNAMKELVRLGANPALVVSGVGAPLNLAASAEDPKLIEALLAAGCNPNTKIDDEPLLFDAQLEDRKEIVQMLLQYGADINATDSLGNSTLKYAIGTSHYDMAIYLIEHGADVHSKTFDGVSIAYSAERAYGRMQSDSPGAKKLEKIIDMMKSKGVKFPADPPSKK